MSTGDIQVRKHDHHISFHNMMRLYSVKICRRVQVRVKTMLKFQHDDMMFAPCDAFVLIQVSWLVL